MSTNTTPSSAGALAGAPAGNPAGDSAGTELDAALAARVAALSASRKAAVAVAPTTPAAASDLHQKPRRRRHAARGARAAALGLSLATTGGLSFAFAVADAGAGALVTPATVISTGPADSTAIGTSSGLSVVNGAVYMNKFGPVQVQAQFAADGSLANVAVIQSPNADNKSVRINDRALPALNSEALTAQSANVDTVSGATYTTNDYRLSLQSALDAARMSAITQLA